MPKITLPDDLKEQFREAGRRGGKQTAAKHGSAFFVTISAKAATARRAAAEARRADGNNNTNSQEHPE